MAILVVTLVHCTDQPPSRTGEVAKEHVIAARTFTNDCAASRLAAWKVRASAAGDDCGVLLIETPIILEHTIVEALHYGTGDYGVHRGGVNQFMRARAFRGVAYKDGSGELWLYGNLARKEAESLRPCR